MTEVTISPAMDDAAFARAVGKALRGPGALRVMGDLAGPLGPASLAWIAALHAARTPVEVEAAGPVGARGLALLLMADAVRAETATATAEAARHPLVAAIAVHRLGPLAARRLAAADDAIGLLREVGHISSGPAATASLRRAWRAAAELPFAEAIEFAALLPSDLEETR